MRGTRTVVWILAAAVVTTTVGAHAVADEKKPAAPAPAPAAKPKEKDADPPLSDEEQKKHDEAVAFWVKRLRSEKNRETVRQQIATLGAEKSRAARDALIVFATGNSNQEYVKHAFDALARIAGKTVVEFLCGKEALTSRDFLVQVSAAQALGETRDRRAVDTLLEVLEGKMTKIEVQGACLIALGRCGKADASAAEALFRYGEHRHDTVRANALEGIGHLGTDEAVKVLAKHLAEDRNTRCRGAAATGLGWTKRKEAVPLLRAAAADESMTVRECATRALQELGAAAK